MFFSAYKHNLFIGKGYIARKGFRIFVNNNTNEDNVFFVLHQINKYDVHQFIKCVSNGWLAKQIKKKIKPKQFVEVKGNMVKSGVRDWVIEISEILFLENPKENYSKEYKDEQNPDNKYEEEDDDEHIVF